MTKDMTKGSPLLLILRFCLPMVFGNILQQFYNLADTAIVGRCINSDALAAIGGTGAVCFLVIGYAAMQSKEIHALMPALQSSWLGFHVSTAIIAYGAFGVSCVLGIIFLLRDRMKDSAFLDQHIPSREKLDMLGYRSVSLGLLFLTFTIVTGAIWAERAWGSYWSWDPKETWSLVTWLIYAVYLHLRMNRNWRGKTAAVFAVLGFIAVIFTYIGVNTLLPGVHSYK